MDIAQRIQDLRKAKGLSQEELADRIGVSRQAVSKWESAQSLPEYDKLIMLSDFFEVSTDYLMKGVEPTKSVEQSLSQNGVNKNVGAKAKAQAIASSSIILTGLLTTLALWSISHNFPSIAAGLILQAGGCAFFAIGLVSADEETKAKVKSGFFAFNVWTLSFMPFSLLINTIVQKHMWVAPYPELLVNGWAGMIFTLIACLIYIAICAAVSMTQIKKLKNRR